MNKKLPKVAIALFGNLFGSPPPDAKAIAWVGEAQWLLVLWGYWVDRRRVPASGASLQPGWSAHG